MNVEIPTNPDYSDTEIDEEDMVPGAILCLQMLFTGCGWEYRAVGSLAKGTFKSTSLCVVSIEAEAQKVREQAALKSVAFLNCLLPRQILRHHAFKQPTGLKPCQPGLQLWPGLSCKPGGIGMRKLAHEGQGGHVCNAGLIAD